MAVLILYQHVQSKSAEQHNFFQLVGLVSDDFFCIAAFNTSEFPDDVWVS